MVPTTAVVGCIKYFELQPAAQFHSAKPGDVRGSDFRNMRGSVKILRRWSRQKMQMERVERIFKSEVNELALNQSSSRAAVVL